MIKGGWGGGELGEDPPKEGGLTFARIERKTPVLRPALQLNQSSLCGLHRSKYQGGRGLDGRVVCMKRAAHGRRQRSKDIIDGEIEKYRAKNGSLPNI